MNQDRGSTTPTTPPPRSPEVLQHPSPTSAQPAAEDQSEEPVEPVEPVQPHSAAEEQKMEALTPQSRLPRLANTRTSEPATSQPARSDRNHRTNDHAHGHAVIGPQAAHLLPEHSSTPSTPSTLAPFDWDDLESRFEKALSQANQNEQELMAEFEALVKYFNVWASTASTHDNDRATKRLQTRTQFVKLKEVDLASKKQNYEQVVQAFQSAMMLLSQAQD